MTSIAWAISIIKFCQLVRRNRPTLFYESTTYGNTDFVFKIRSYDTIKKLVGVPLMDLLKGEKNILTKLKAGTLFMGSFM